MIEPTAGGAGVFATAEPVRGADAEHENFEVVLERAAKPARKSAGPAPLERSKIRDPGDALDAASNAAAQLATAGPVKATTAAALEEQTSPGAEPATQAAARPHNSRAAIPMQAKEVAGAAAQQPEPATASQRAAGSGMPAEAADTGRGNANQGATTPSSAPIRQTAQQRLPQALAPGKGAPPAAVAKATASSAQTVPVRAGAAANQPKQTRAGEAPPKAAPARRTPEAPEAQFARGLSAALRQGGGTVTLHLKPQELGDLKIRLEIDGASVEARFEAATDEARGLLDQSIDSLRAALEAKGLEVERLSVHVAERTNEHDAQDAPPGDHGGRHGGREQGGSNRGAARTPREQDAGTELLVIPVALADACAGLGGALRLDAIA
jgi:flagellar hook-length control protein FliK